MLNTRRPGKRGVDAVCNQCWPVTPAQCSSCKLIRQKTRRRRASGIIHAFRRFDKHDGNRQKRGRAVWCPGALAQWRSAFAKGKTVRPFPLAPRHDLPCRVQPSLCFFGIQRNRANAVAAPHCRGRAFAGLDRNSPPARNFPHRGAGIRERHKTLCCAAAPNRGRPPKQLGVRRSNENAPLLNLLIYHPGSEAAPDSSFYVELARRAAETGRAIIRAEQPVEMATRFGAFEIARLGLERNGAAAKKCLGFRFANAEPKLRITGFACGGGEAPTSPLTPSHQKRRSPASSTRSTSHHRPKTRVSSIFSPRIARSAAPIAQGRGLVPRPCVRRGF
jgi:hypothetical protein